MSMEDAVRFEWALLFGLVIVIAIAELISLRRAIRKAREKERIDGSGSD